MYLTITILFLKQVFEIIFFKSVYENFFPGSDMTLDDRSFVMQAVMIMDVPNSVSYFYPRLIPLHELQPSEDGSPLEIPSPIRCSVEKMVEQGVYLLGKYIKFV